MPTKPNMQTLNATSVDILNAIRNSATANYQNYIPPANKNVESIRAIGNIIMQYPTLQNEFLNALINRIGRVLITSKMYENPWAVFKRGTLDFGETIEEIFVNIAKPFEYDPAVAENKVFAREMPDVRAAFHVMNYQKFYKTTIQNDNLRQAFLSFDGITNLIAKITQSLYSAANYDEFQTMKYLLAVNILNGRLSAMQVPTISSENMKGVISTIKGVSNDFTFMNNAYNVAGVANYADKDEQFIIINSAFDAAMDVDVLAAAFNMEKADFMGHRVLIDGFGKLDTARLNELFANDANYTPLTPEQLNALNEIPAVLVSRDWFMIYDNLYNFTENYNGQGLYWNYFYHVWKTFSISPFANGAVFVPGAPEVTAVTISPTEVTTRPAQTVLLTANVETNNFASKAVIWTTDQTSGVSVDPLGNVTIDPDFSGTAITVTATSVFDNTKAATATITVTQ